MLELYNNRLQDLFVSLAGEAHAQPQSHGQVRRVEIKRNRKGVVFAQGAETKEASSAQELYALFQQACANRHISATSESSIPCNAAQFKQGPAKWFGLIVLVTVSLMGRQQGTSLLDQAVSGRAVKLWISILSEEGEQCFIDAHTGHQSQRRVHRVFIQ